MESTEEIIKGNYIHRMFQVPTMDSFDAMHTRNTCHVTDNETFVSFSGSEFNEYSMEAWIQIYYLNRFRIELYACLDIKVY
jgi:hypothetical protein